MYGFAAIEHANGWAMAGTGAGIVLSGLAVLSFLISMLPRLTGLFEKKTVTNDQRPQAPQSKTVHVGNLPNDLDAACSICMELTKELGETFVLIDLHKTSKRAGIPDPHLWINRFRLSGRLVCVGDEQFAWQPSSE